MANWMGMGLASLFGEILARAKLRSKHELNLEVELVSGHHVIQKDSFPNNLYAEVEKTCRQGQGGMPASPGQRAKIAGLVRHVEHNDKVANVCGYHDSYWSVALDDGARLNTRWSNLHSTRRLRGKQPFPTFVRQRAFDNMCWVLFMLSWGGVLAMVEYGTQQQDSKFYERGW